MQSAEGHSGFGFGKLFTAYGVDLVKLADVFFRSLASVEKVPIGRVHVARGGEPDADLFAAIGNVDPIAVLLQVGTIVEREVIGRDDRGAVDCLNLDPIAYNVLGNHECHGGSFCVAVTRFGVG